MARHRSPRGTRIELPPRPDGGTRRRRAAHRGPSASVRAAAAVGAAAAGVIIASQTVTLGSGDAAPDDAGSLAVGELIAQGTTSSAPASTPEPTPEPVRLRGAAAAVKVLPPPPPPPPTTTTAAETTVEETSEEETTSAAPESSEEAASGSAGCPSSGYGGVAPHVAAAGSLLQAKFGIDDGDIGGVASRPGNPTSDHPRGYALDFMVDTATGDALAAYAEANTEALGIKYILWQVPDHYDHVHISFTDEPGSGLPC